MIYRTGARCVDAVGLGWHRVDGHGWLTFVQAKTGGPATCPVKTLPQWAEALRAERALFLVSVPRDRMIWIMTQNGQPRSVKGLSQRRSFAASAAGLPDDWTAKGVCRSAGRGGCLRLSDLRLNGSRDPARVLARHPPGRPKGRAQGEAGTTN